MHDYAYNMILNIVADQGNPAVWFSICDLVVHTFFAIAFGICIRPRFFRGRPKRARVD